MEGNPVRLKEIVENPAFNALRHCSARGRLQVTLAHEGDWIRLETDNYSTPIPSEALPRLWGPFTGAMPPAAAQVHAVSRDILCPHRDNAPEVEKRNPTLWFFGYSTVENKPACPVRIIFLRTLPHFLRQKAVGSTRIPRLSEYLIQGPDLRIIPGV